MLYCTRICISQRDMTRHVNVNHPEKSTTKRSKETVSEGILSFESFEQLLRNSSTVLSGEGCYPTYITSQFKQNNISEYSKELNKVIEPITVSFRSKGDAEKFYPSFSSTVPESMITGLYKFCGISSNTSLQTTCWLSYHKLKL